MTSPRPTAALLIVLAVACLLTAGWLAGAASAPTVSIGDHVLAAPLACQEDEHVELEVHAPGEAVLACVHLIEAVDPQGRPTLSEWTQEVPAPAR